MDILRGSAFHLLHHYCYSKDMFFLLLQFLLIYFLCLVFFHICQFLFLDVYPGI